ncbi:MAG: oligopeptidase B [Planctomycetes bacterium]|jgi:oligopeptidase B|nr:oligopeptidase B [Planctomycetota bacterium]
MRNQRVLLPFLVLIGGCKTEEVLLSDSKPTPVEAPNARVEARRLKAHGDVRIDNYYWLRRRGSEEVLDYLKAENAYVESRLAHTKALQKELFDEMVGRVRQDDATVPYRLGDYLYYTRFEEGKQYPIHCRRSVARNREQVLLNLNSMAEEGGYLGVGRRVVSPDQQRIAYGVDRIGRRIYTIEVKDLASGAIVDSVPDVTSNVVWAEDGETLFYTKQDPETLRTFQIWRHVVGQSGKDQLVFEEDDTEFSCFVTKTRSRRFLLIGCSQTLTSEYRILEADNPMGAFRVVAPRQRGHEYSVDHHGDHLYMVSNLDAENFRLMRAPLDSSGISTWEELIPHRVNVLLEDVEFFRSHMVVSERSGGLVRLRVIGMNGGDEYQIEFDEPAYTIAATDNPEFDTQFLRYTYSSLTTPRSVYDHNLKTRKRILKKRQEVMGGFDPANYRTERLHATADDGALVPISLVYRMPFAKDGRRPLLLYGYGSYGYSIDARFSPNLISLLDRGFAYAIAHIRGGQELGRRWYEDGKLLNKQNTFTDFIASGDFLAKEGYTSPDRLFALGGSAGGLLIGAVINQAPQLFHGVVAAVPFVDVVTTMLDDSIPLTTSEYDEWGNPNDKTYYDYMLSYSPYDQVSAQDYPHLLVTTGLHDSQVQYWEPAKWVAKLRAMKTGDDLLLFKTEMEAGHGGASGRYRRYEEQALIYAFLLELAPGPRP